MISCADALLSSRGLGARRRHAPLPAIASIGRSIYSLFDPKECTRTSPRDRAPHRFHYQSCSGLPTGLPCRSSLAVETGVRADKLIHSRTTQPGHSVRKYLLALFPLTLTSHSLPRRSRLFPARVVLSSRKNLIAPMADRVTKPHSPRGSMYANVKTMGGQALPENAAASLSEIRQWGAPYRTCTCGLAAFAAGVGFFKDEKHRRQDRQRYAQTSVTCAP